MAQRFFLLFFLFFYHFVTVQSVIYELKGQQVQFDPNNTRQPIEILWRHKGKIIVEFNGIEEQVFGSYAGRVTLNRHSAQLQISDLSLEDSGQYECAIYMNRNFFRQSYELEVIEKVPKPTITCQMNNSSSSNVSAVLLCSVELNQTQSSLKFEWRSKGNVRYGPQLTVFLGGELYEEEYTCRVSNPASSETATFRAKDCCTDAGLSAKMIVVIVGISILIVIIYVGSLVLLCTLRPKRHVNEQEAQLEMNHRPENPPTDPDTELLQEAADTNVAVSSTEADPAGPVRENGAEFNEVALTQTVHTAANVQRSLDEETAQDEEPRPLVEDRPTASSSQPRKEPNTENEVSRIDEADPAAVSDGVTEDMVSHQEFCSAPQRSVLDKEKTQEEEKRPLLEEWPTAPSPHPQRQLDTENEVSRTDEADPAAVSDGVTEDMVSHQESCSDPEHCSDSKKSRGEQAGPAPPPSSLHDNTSSALEERDCAVNDKLDGGKLREAAETNVAQSSTEAAPADQPTASSPQLQRQLETENEVGRTDEADPAAVSDGVTEDMVSHQDSRYAPQHSVLDKETAQDEEKRPLLEDRPTAPSPHPQRQLDTENARDVESQCKLLPKAHEEESQEQQLKPGYVRGRVAKIEKMASKQTDTKATNEQRS